MPERSLEELIRFMLDLDEINGKIIFLLVEQLGSPASLSVLLQTLYDNPSIPNIGISELEKRLRHMEAQGLVELDTREEVVYLRDAPENFLMPNIAKLQSAADLLSEKYFFRKYSFRPFAHFREKTKLIERVLYTVQDAQPGDNIFVLFSRFSSISISKVQSVFNKLVKAGVNFHLFFSKDYVLSNPHKADGFIFLYDLKKRFPQKTHLYNYSKEYNFFDEVKFLVVDGSVHRLLFVIDDHDEYGNLTGGLGYVSEHSATVACFRRYFELLMWSGECEELDDSDLSEMFLPNEER